MSHRRRTGAAAAFALCVGLACQPSASGDKAQGAAAGAARTEDQLVLYALGAAVSRPLESFHLKPEEAEHVAAGFRDALAGAPLQATPDAYMEKIQALQTERRKIAAQAEEQASAAFLAKAAGEEGAVQTPSGLVYLEEEAGTGKSPGPDDVVSVHYHGTLRDGTVFDSSVERGTPATFPLNRVIPCWREGLQRMHVGGKARLVCPASLAYGDMGAPPRIPGGAALQFEVQLLEIGSGSDSASGE